MPSVSASRVVAASPAEIWSVLSDIAHAGRWNASWSRIEITSDQAYGEGASFRAFAEDGASFDFKVTAWAPPELITFTPIRSAAERYAIALEGHTFRLERTGEHATNLHLTAHASTHGLRGHIYSLFFWRGYQKQGLNKALSAVQELFEPQTDASAAESTPATE